MQEVLNLISGQDLSQEFLYHVFNTGFTAGIVPYKEKLKAWWWALSKDILHTSLNSKEREEKAHVEHWGCLEHTMVCDDGVFCKQEYFLFLKRYSFLFMTC